MIKKAKIGVKITGGLITVLFFTVIVGAVSLYSVDKIKKIVDQLVSLEIPETSAVMQTEREMWRTHVFSYDFDKQLDEQSKQLWFSQRAKVEKAADQIIPIAETLDHQNTLKAADSIKQKLNEYSSIGENYTALAFKNKNLETELKTHAAVIEKQALDYIDGQNRKIKDAYAVDERNVARRSIAKLQTAHEVMNHYHLIRRHALQYFLNLKQVYADQIEDELKQLISALNDVADLSMDPKDIERMTTVIKHAEIYGDLVEQWIKNKKKQIALLQRSDQAAEDILGVTVKTTRQADQDAYEVGAYATRIASNAKHFLLILLISAMGLGTLFSVLISRSITGPIKRLIQDLLDSSGQVASASGQVSASSQSLAEGASEQAASIEETSSSLEEMASMTQQNASNAGEAETLMKEAGQVVQNANASMGQLTGSIEDISTASEETRKIIKTIDEIAFQTNLLALNAAVEAARAGEAGAGFAVVADEVRNLAVRSAEAARNTTDLIEKTVNRVSEGSELVSVTNESFMQVAESASRVGKLITEISVASSEQAQGIDQITKAVAQMESVIQNNAANAEESASASEEMSAQAVQMKTIVGELTGMIHGHRGMYDNGNLESQISGSRFPLIPDKPKSDLSAH